MALDQIRTQIEAILTAADPGSKVYPYRRWIIDPGALAAELQPELDGPIRVWMFWIESIAESLDTHSLSDQSYVVGLRLYYSLADAARSEIAVTDLVQTVRAAFRANLDLNGAAFSTVPTTGPMRNAVALQLDSLEVVTLAGVLCHQAALRLGVQEQLAL